MGSGGRFLTLLSPASPLLQPRSSSLLRFSRHRLLPSILHYRHHFSPPLQLSPTTNSTDSTLVPYKPCHRQLHTQCAGQSFSEPLSRALPHPWSEFSELVDNLTVAGYCTSGINSNYDSNYDEFVAASSFPEEFLRAASACLAFARDRTSVLGLLSTREIEVVVRNGQPFLFRNGEESARRMRVFLGGAESNVLDNDKANMSDLMRFLLSYASNADASSVTNNLYNRELVVPSVRNLLGELVKLSRSPAVSNPFGSAQTQLPDRYAEAPRSFGKNVPMKRGDWICPRCNFMNFARNVKCLECEEARPKKLLTGGEWECPQCDFFNYGRNTACLRCDCKRPGDLSLGNIGLQLSPSYGNGSYLNKDELDQRLAANEEKAKRWFSKISQMENSPDMSSAIADEDFPEIMPLRKGVNRFVVSTRKTPLERRLANAQYQENMRNDFLAGGANESVETNVRHNLDEILGQSSAASESSGPRTNSRQHAEAENISTTASSVTPISGQPRGTNSNFVPFVPLPVDMFAKESETLKREESQKAMSDGSNSITFNRSEQTATSMSNEFHNSGNSQQLSEVHLNQKESSDREKEQAEKSGRWFKRIAELHDDADLSSAVPDDDFPETMPMRKGENRFVVSRKKDRSLTSPIYKRRLALEQANNANNYVPFVPFPPDYFARKDEQQPQGTNLDGHKVDDTSTSVGLGNHADGVHEVSSRGGSHGKEYQWEALGKTIETSNSAVYEPQSSMNTNPDTVSQTSSYSSLSSGCSANEAKTEMRDFVGTSEHSEQNIRKSWTGKTLEGSAVKEPDPLDMSEEAKAERWFRRVAQIKDISELSQIPDEDFPSIMPIRKGVNRFVVSKRKTPLERRLTSQQYRKNLPIVNSEPLKREDDNNSN